VDEGVARLLSVLLLATREAQPTRQTRTHKQRREALLPVRARFISRSRESARAGGVGLDMWGIFSFVRSLSLCLSACATASCSAAEQSQCATPLLWLLLLARSRGRTTERRSRS